MPRISVVIPTYNRLALVTRAIDSVCAQTYQDFEILLIDDGSIEPIHTLADSYSQLQIIRHETRQGAAAARNTGIRAAKCEYVAFLDSDDFWLPEKLKAQLDLLDAHPGLGACTTGYHNHTNEASWTYKPIKPKSWVREMAMGCQLGPGTTLFVRRECYATVGYLDEAMPRLEDLDWLIRFARHYDIGVIPEALAVVQRSGFSSAAAMEAANTILLRKHSQSFRKLGRFFGTRAIGKRWLEVAVHYFREGNRKKGFLFLLKAIRTNPVLPPGMYLRIFDSLMGTSFLPFLKKAIGYKAITKR
jgi:glycosyltransferase involved in cell wall biosynthesis